MGATRPRRGPPRSPPAPGTGDVRLIRELRDLRRFRAVGAGHPGRRARPVTARTSPGAGR
ncbi:hypothetical protein CTZ28_37065 [Streptomyces shenzhenensis]|uniref:Uncharacterized protein n=1 Tax=Streptomyces shenzhenensis TaxID=943815 RepID=A0A3M0HWZ1_9ACTN|nr:hypothetical protein CTZ28_37065 [Streptomyces shenzhenensis]